MLFVYIIIYLGQLTNHTLNMTALVQWLKLWTSDKAELGLILGKTILGYKLSSIGPCMDILCHTESRVNSVASGTHRTENILV